MVLACCPLSFALNPDLDVSQYAHTVWKTREGFAKGSISSIAQTPDGYLWLGTDFGLLRFDGVRNAAWEPPADQPLPSQSITNLLVSRDGSLWIGTAKGLARWKDGKLTQFAQLAGVVIYPLHEDRQGTVWVGTIALNDGKLCAIQDSVVQCHGGGDRFGHGVLALHEDGRSNLWMSVSNGVWRWKPGTPEFHPMPGALDGIQSFADDHDALLIGTANGIQRLVNNKATPYPVSGATRQFRVQRLLPDRDGGLWIGTSNQGVAHVHQGRTDTFTLRDGLSGDYVTALFEDREGSIWIATLSGLDRFRDLAVPTFAVAQGLSSADALSVLGTKDGSIWIGTPGGLSRWRSGQFATLGSDRYKPDGNAAPRSSAHSLFQDTLGRIWVSGTGGIGYFEQDRFVPQSGVPGGSPVHAIAEDTEGNVWIAQQDDGLFRVSRGGAVQHTSWAELGRKDFASALVADPVRGGIWIGFFESGLAYFNNGQVRVSYSVADGLGEGRINNLRFDRQGALWAATEGGLSRVKSGRLATLHRRNGLPCDAAHWDIEDDADSVWLYMSCGLIRIPAVDVEAWAAGVDNDRDPTRAVHITVFDSSDGVKTRADAAGYSPQAAKSADGRIWFSSLEGVMVVDPRHLPVNAIPPPVNVEQVTADRRPYDVASAANPRLRMPPLVRDLQIDYTALSLVAPEKMQFRYKLEGRDADWQDVGTRRQAFYTDLSPGNYRFRVTASNNSGVWNETGATIDFTIAPAYYQTTWFLALSVASVLAAVWTAHRVRLRIVERHQREISALNERMMKAQEQERIRIAGELHDGVMQEMLAATMMLGTAKRRIADDSAATATIDKVQQKLIQAGTDLRQLSHDLHPPLLQEAGLPKAVQGYCEQFSAAGSIPVDCHADDSAGELSRGAALALFRILQEALGNVAKHASASRITVRLAREDGLVTLVVSDNGVGLDCGGLATGGGLGLVMMRERAMQLNGRFEFDSTPGHGTTIRVNIPFR